MGAFMPDSLNEYDPTQNETFDGTYAGLRRRRHRHRARRRERQLRARRQRPPELAGHPQ
jgi:hypothetical protein